MPDRILVYGVTGSGKSTLAVQIAERTGLPCHLVDELTWEPGWVVVAPEVQRARISAICAGEQWVLDSAYSQWIDVPMARVQLIVGLDYPRWLSLGRLLRRTLVRTIDHRPICNGNTETWREALSRDSIIVWHFRSFTRKRRRIRAWAKDAAAAPTPSERTGPVVIRLTSPRATRRWLQTLPHG